MELLIKQLIGTVVFFALCVCLLIYGLYCLGVHNGDNAVKVEAVQKGHGTWQVDEHGHTVFKWNQK